MSEFVEIASVIAQSPFTFSILFILVGGFLIWFLYTKFNKNEEKEISKDQELKESYDNHQQQLLKIMNDNNRRNEKRESEYMDHNKMLVEQVNRSNNSLEQISETLKEVNKSVASIQKQQEIMQLKTDKEFEKIWNEVKKE